MPIALPQLHLALPDRAAPKRPSRSFLISLMLVIVASITLGIVLFNRYRDQHRSLWTDTIHDRHAHLLSGMRIAVDLRNLDAAKLISDLHKYRTWPPLHDGLMVGISLLVGGLDERAAILPSLLSWMGTAIVAFLLARRLVPVGGDAAGLIAAAFVLVSPAQRAFATDVMIESPGAFLTLLTLYFHVLTVQTGTRRASTAFALSLTALFLTKYNYWTLVLAGVTLVSLPVLRPYATEFIRSLAWRPLLGRWLRSPFIWLFGASALAIAWLRLTGGTDITLGGRIVKLRSTSLVTSIAFTALVLQLLVEYRRTGRAWLAACPPPFRDFVYWHIAPVVVWFLWPMKLDQFLWYLGPNQTGERPQRDLLGGYPYYAELIAADYHISTWTAILAGAGVLAAVIAVGMRRLNPGVAVLVATLAISIVLTAQHPNRKSRFLHTWLPIGWVMAGVGLVSLLPRRTSLPPDQGERFPLLAYSVSALTIGLLAPGSLAEARSPEGGPRTGAISALDVTDAFLDDLADSRRAYVLSNLPIKMQTEWTVLQRYGRSMSFASDVRDFHPDDPNHELIFQRWLATLTEYDVIVYVSIPPGSPLSTPVPGHPAFERYGELLRNQTTLTCTRITTVHGCEVSVWRMGR